MAIPTVNQLALTMMREFGEDSSNSSLVSQVEQWVQDVYDQIGISADWNFLWLITNFNTVIGQRTYNLGLPNSFSQEISIKRSSDNYSLINKTRQELMQSNYDLLLAGEPEIWYKEPSSSVSSAFTIGLYRVPSSVITLEVLGLLQPIEFISSTVLYLPREFIFLMKEGIRIKFKEDDKDYSGADRAQRKFNEALRRLKEKNDTPIAIIDQMKIVDIASGRDPLVKLDPNHFRN